MKKRMILIKPWDKSNHEPPIIVNDESSQKLMDEASQEYYNKTGNPLYSCLIVDGYDKKEELSQATNIPIKLLTVSQEYKGKEWFFSPKAIAVSFNGNFYDVFDVPQSVQDALAELPMQNEDLVPDRYYRD